MSNTVHWKQSTEAGKLLRFGSFFKWMPIGTLLVGEMLLLRVALSIYCKIDVFSIITPINRWVADHVQLLSAHFEAR